MLAKINSGAVVGLDAVRVEVEVDVSSGALPSFTIVGLGDKAVEEAKERTRAAIKNSGADFPTHRITVNLAPADLPKEGTLYDLPIAVGLLLANGQLPPESLSDSLVFGELALDGTLRPIPGSLSLAIFAKNSGVGKIFMPLENAEEASLVPNITIYPVNKLRDIVDHILGVCPISPHTRTDRPQMSTPSAIFDMADVKGQEFAKRGLEIAAAGGHNVFLSGPPGAGKTMLARAMAGILPELSVSEQLEVSKIYSVIGLLPSQRPAVFSRPFRSPHHTTSHVGLVGGGTHPKPGEISMAHRGVLFMDEFPEYSRQVLEAMRQPLEDGVITISRAQGSITFPAKFILVAAANPCPCGFLGDMKNQCRCSPSQIAKYQRKISGPIMDRIDLNIACRAVPLEKLTEIKNGESSSNIAKRVTQARQIQLKRFANQKITTNSEMNSREVKSYCPLTNETANFLLRATVKINLSARGYFRIIKVARTIADLAGEATITTDHIAEALQFRQKSISGFPHF